MSKERKTALITCITGQDGSYLAELLLEKGYIVPAETILLRTPTGKYIALGFFVRNRTINLYTCTFSITQQKT